LSRERCNGQREAILRRDHFQCRVCGCPEERQLLVHHRDGASNDPSTLITLCRKCHVRIHRTFRPGWGFLVQSLLRRLWREANQTLAEQRLLSLLAEEGAEHADRQLEFFDEG